MIIFYSDLDNTLIYSYKHDIGMDKRCAEIYEGREIAFLTNYTYELLQQISEKILIVPTTTRTIEQYKRIDLGMGVFPYALTCNGGVLLIDGKEDEEWYQESLKMVSESKQEITKAMQILEADKNRILEVAYIKELFLYTKSSEPEKSVEELKKQLDLSLVDAFYHHFKVYVVPKKLTKGNAVKRLQKKLKGETIIAAGDSIFDVSMLEYADYAFAPDTLKCRKREDGTFIAISSQEIFSEKMLEEIWKIIGY